MNASVSRTVSGAVIGFATALTLQYVLAATKSDRTQSQNRMQFTEPSPLDFYDHEGYASMNWMMTGPQADFWPSRVYTGQFYSENTPMRILAWRGQVVDGFGERSKRLMGTIGDRQALGAIVKQNDWNQYT